MHEKVKRYLDEKQKIIEEKKENFLVSQGLYEKKYSPEERFSGEYPKREWDENKESFHYYKNEVVKMTDEEYQAVLDAYNATNEPKPKEVGPNVVGALILALAWGIYVAGFFLGIFMGVEAADYLENFSFGVALIYWGTSFVCGTFFIGFSQIIKLLHSINEKI